MDLNYSRDIDTSFEIDHWWIRARHRLIDRAINTLPNSYFSVLEVGAGTGVNLQYIHQRYANRLRTLIGTDPHSNSEATASFSIQKELPKGRFELILLLDVLEHCADPVTLLKELRLHLVDGGRLLVTVPAFQSLWSQYDELAHHFKRYSFKGLRNELKASGWQIKEQFFLFAAVFPLFVLQRILVRLGWSDPRVFKQTPSFFNWCLYAITRVEIAIGMLSNRWMGSSIVALASLKTKSYE